MSSGIVRIVLGSIVLSSFVITIIVLAGNTNAQEGINKESEVVYQDENSALADDVALLATETGFSVEDVERSIMSQQEFAEYGEELLFGFPIKSRLTGQSHSLMQRFTLFSLMKCQQKLSKRLKL